MNPSSESGTHEIRNGNPKGFQPLASPEFLFSRLVHAMDPSSESGTHEIRNGNPKGFQPLASPEFLISRLIPQ